MNNLLKQVILLLYVFLGGCLKDNNENAALKILFVTRDINDRYDLNLYMHVMNLDGSEVKKIVDFPVYILKPSVSKKYKKIAFTCEYIDQDTPKAELYVVNSNGTDLKLISKSHRRYNSTPCWSHDDLNIIYTKYMVDSPYCTSVYLYNFNTSQEFQLTNEGNCSDAKFSPDDKIISYTSGFKLYFMDVDGANKRLIVPNIVYDYNWSPGSDQIVYYGKDENNSKQIYLIELSGDSIKKLTDRFYLNPDEINFGNRFPTWTPDGKKIVYESDINEDVSEIWIMDIDGQNKKRLSDDGTGDRMPVVSPDGKKILFLSDLYCLGCREIKIMDISGDNKKSLSNNRFTDQYPEFIKY
jgi:Tol biopolymer transport system component